MAKRFIDTGLFDDEWFSNLDTECKLFWLYYLTKCDHAGLLKFNKKLIEFQTGINSIERVIKHFDDRLVRVNEQLFFCPKFIVFQYPGFPKSNVKQQTGAIKLLIDAGIWDEQTSKFKELLNSKLTLNEVLPKTYVNVNGIVNGNTLVDRKGIEDAIFSDNVFIDELKRMHPGKDIRKAWDECFQYHIHKPTKLADWEWRQKLGTWLIKFEPKKSVKKQNGFVA